MLTEYHGNLLRDSPLSLLSIVKLFSSLETKKVLKIPNETFLKITLYLYQIFVFLLDHLHFFLHFFFVLMKNLFKKHPILHGNQMPRGFHATCQTANARGKTPPIDDAENCLIELRGSNATSGRSTRQIQCNSDLVSRDYPSLTRAILTRIDYRFLR